MSGRESQAASISDEAQRQAIYADIQQAVIDDMAPVVTVRSQPLIALVKPNVKNLTINAMNYYFLNDVYVSDE